MIKLKYGNTNTYFIDGLLLDTDMPETLPLFFREIKNKGIAVGDVKYVMASHYHPDHIGLISQLMKMGIRLVLLENQVSQVHCSDEIFHRRSGTAYLPIDEKQALVISAEESRSFLNSIGIFGEIIPTLSHSKDGIALILDDGSCFVGDLEPIQYIEAYANNKVLEKDWSDIMRYRPKTVYFGHWNELNIQEN